MFTACKIKIPSLKNGANFSPKTNKPPPYTDLIYCALIKAWVNSTVTIVSDIVYWY